MIEEVCNEKLMHFDNDDVFVNFCLSSQPTLIKGKTVNGYDYDFTPQYTKALDDGCYFIINDPNSLVMKRGAVCKGLITKKVDNLAMLCDDDDDDLI